MTDLIRHFRGIVLEHAEDMKTTVSLGIVPDQWSYGTDAQVDIKYLKEAADELEAKDQIIAELVEALTALHVQAERVYIGSLTPMDIKGAAHHLVHPINAAERVLSKAKTLEER